MFKQKSKPPTPEPQPRITGDFNNRLNNPDFARGYWCAIFKSDYKSINPYFKFGYAEGINDVKTMIENRRK